MQKVPGRDKPCLEILDGPRFNNEVGPQLALGSIARVAQLVVASLPEPIGSEPKADGGYSQNYRESADDALVVPLKKKVGLFEGERRSHMEGGAVFFMIVIGGLLIVLWLYQAQR
jgi:hypothetical protein